ncbi:MAG: O-antigen ligase family protein [Candidatus Peregrinibacteria bacterium]|nr:O-antigen ligase family protein [Candidatus Peregrinibacteria bacterium]
MMLQTVLASLQYLYGASLGLSFLGEPLLHVGDPGVATVSLFGRTVLRGYGTFLHPNIFAAYALFGIFLSLLYRKTRPLFFSFAVFFLTLGVILSFSRMAFMALIVLFFFSYSHVQLRLSARKIGLFFLGVLGVVAVCFISGLSYVFMERFQFTDLTSLQFRYANFVDGIKLFLHMPFGTGLGRSTALMQSISPLKYAPWQYQPAHNLLLVVSDELGVLGLILYIIGIIFLVRFLYHRRKTHPFHVAAGVSFLCLSLSDHYFFTLYHGQILMTLFLSFLALAAQESSPSSH